MAKIYIEDGRIVGTETTSQVCGKVPDGVYVRAYTQASHQGTSADVYTESKGCSQCGALLADASGPGAAKA